LEVRQISSERVINMLLEPFNSMMAICSSDSRRTIREHVWEKEGSALQYFKIHGVEGAMLRLGNHYHNGSYAEKFLILRGGGKVGLAEVDEVGTPGKVRWVDISPFFMIDVGPLTAHVFELEAGTVMLCWVTGVDADHKPGVAVSCVISDQ